jgi:hypothetical protein
MAVTDPWMMVLAGWIGGTACTVISIKGAIPRYSRFADAVRVGALSSAAAGIVAYLIIAIARYFV